MSKSLNTLLSLNGDKIKSGNIIPEEHSVYVVGTYKLDAEKNVIGINFVQRTRPNAAAKAAGIKRQRYLRTSFKRTGEIITGESGMKSFKGGKRAQYSNVFKNTQSDMYDFLLAELDKTATLVEGKWSGEGFEQVGEEILIENGNEVKHPKVRVNATVFGARVSMITPKYTPHVRENGGKPKPLTGTAYDPKTDKYIKGKPVVMSVYRFFADLDDLDELENVAVNHYEKNVELYETESKITQTTKGNVVTTETTEETLTDEVNEVVADPNDVDPDDDEIDDGN